MTTLTREAIGKLSGRELDAAVAHHVFKTPSVYAWPTATYPFAGIPKHSHPDCRGLAEMIAKARENWWITIEETGTENWTVNLLEKKQGSRNARDIEGDGSTLPEAFARALLLTTIPPEGTP